MRKRQLQGHDLKYEFEERFVWLMAEYRRQWRISVKDMAKACLVSSNTYSSWESRKSLVPLWAVDAWCIAAGFSYAEIAKACNLGEYDIFLSLPRKSGKVWQIMTRHKGYGL